jgi:hypothetical protein
MRHRGQIDRQGGAQVQTIGPIADRQGEPFRTGGASQSRATKLTRPRKLPDRLTHAVVRYRTTGNDAAKERNEGER